MTANSTIAWTDHTFNPWIGCTRVSPGCVHCYAETFAKRMKKAEWGPQAQRVKTGVSYWKQPLKWNRDEWEECPTCGWRGARKDAKIYNLQSFCPECHEFTEPTRQRVFCASMADVFEENPQVANWRVELFELIEQTPNLDWLILTKRPEMIGELASMAVVKPFNAWLVDHQNVWIGTTVENQAEADKRTKALLNVGPCVRFLSAEPLLERISIPMIEKWNWVIVGGESGGGCRRFDYQWAREIRDDCQAHGVAFFMKQAGGHPYKRDKLADFPNDLKIREYPKA